MTALKEAELKRVLEVLFDELKEKKMLPDGVENKDQLIEKVLEKLQDVEIDKEDLHKSETKNALCLSIAAQALSDKNKNFEFDYKILFKNFRDNAPEHVQKEYKQELKKFLMEYNKVFLNNQFTEKEIDKAVENISKIVFNSLDDDAKSLKDTKNAIDGIADMILSALEMSLKNLFGGIDPHKAGSIVAPVQMIVGNLSGIADQSSTSETSNAFIDEQNRFGGSDSDSLGMKNSIRLRLDKLSDVLEDALKEEGVLSNAPRLEMGGKH